MSEKKETKSGVNEDISEMLRELGEHELNVNQNKFKYISYRKASQSVASYGKRIESAKEAKALPGIGDSIAKKIMEFIENGSTNRQLERIRSSDKSQVIHQLMRVSGIGPKKAAQLCAEGIDSIDQLKTYPKLTDHQKIGLKYVNQFEQKIPRKEIQKMEKLIQNKTNELNENLLLTICGSYRREAVESGDIDVLITHRKITSEQMVYKTKSYLEDLVKCLEKCGFITDRLGLGRTKFSGVCCLAPGLTHRRIDIRFLSLDQYFCGVLYFTGNDFFNQQMRRHSNESGFALNEYSLRRIGLTGVPGEPIPIRSEKEIFEYIDFPYKEPKDRNF